MAENRLVETAGDLFATVSNTPAAQDLRRLVEAGGVLSCGEVSPAAQPFFAALLARMFPRRPVVVVTDGLKTQESFHQDLQTWLSRPGEKGPLFYPGWEVLPHDSRLPHADVISERLETLVALLQKTFAPGEIEKRTRTLRRGDRIDPLDLVEWLEEQAYEPEAQVTHKGEISMRGGILDLWPLTSPWPVRLEFFGNELESLRQFDPITQISRDEIESVTVPPGGELGILKAEANRSGETNFASLIDYLPAEAVLVICDPGLIERQVEAYAGQVPAGDVFYFAWSEFEERSSQRGMVTLKVSDAAMGGNEEESLVESGAAGGPRFQSLEMFRPIGNRPAEAPVAEAQRREFFSQLHRWIRQGYGVHIFCNNDGERQRFGEIWREYGFGGQEGESGPMLQTGAVARGFLCDEARLVVATDAEIFGRYRVQRPRRLKSPHAQTSRSLLDIDFTELEEGDYVVHLQHGIGRYLGLKVLPVSLGQKELESGKAEAAQECLVIEYAPNEPEQEPPRLYVPVTEAHLVSKYVGAGKARPALNHLGGTRWTKAKAQAQNAVRDLASDMLAIQAARESQAGHAFLPDAAWQREFESAFLFEETPDQHRAIVEAKADMERPKPMDRLICGDVGYGKTEVAIRAAFKAVMGGRQVAILVPTTVLAQQHFNTFRERMSDYPIRIELLSRYRSRSEQNKILENLEAGAVDIVIGTHRLVQPDVQFKDLGLVVIDEEQRFGVLHKEKFKRLRKLVDVLTLSATPIPRTLYLALTGARDMSTIETPPQDRLPVETIVTPFDERVIRDAIRREMNRQGQVFFLHNRVGTIEAVALRLRVLVPDARLVVGHGQMGSDELEDVMARFVNGEADVLLSTTIIESGLDIPNANTIIIDRADRFGLSELYQLRGRVGRYKHQAYAYLLLPRHAGLLTEARKRISAIKQYSSLGSGFKIAMRDLEIRGAGNLLGSQQSGHITAVGFELYCQLLRQSIGTLKGEKTAPRVSVQVRLDFLALNPGEEISPERAQSRASHSREEAKENGRKTPAYVPLRYISDAKHRIDVYRKLAQSADKAGLDKLAKELADRFGPIPAPVTLLLLVSELKILAASKSVAVIETQGEKLMLTRNNDFIQVGGKFPRLTKVAPRSRLQEIKRLLLAL